MATTNEVLAQVAQQAGGAYEELVDLAIREIDGNKVRDTPNVFKMADLPAHCKAEDLCRVPAMNYLAAS